MDNKVRQSGESFLNPDILRQNLIIASLFITAFEIMETTIVDPLRDFYTHQWSESGPVPSPRYQNEVLSRNRSPVLASLGWLKESTAIDDQDLAAHKAANDCRNEIVHEIPKMLTSGLRSDLAERFGGMVKLVDKIARWWIVNVEIATDPQFDGQEVDVDGIVPGQTMTLRILMDVALGSDEDSKRYITEWLRLTAAKGTQRIQ